jgi:hypothetical protein
MDEEYDAIVLGTGLKVCLNIMWHITQTITTFISELYKNWIWFEW